jgi:hypothetical protein
MLPAQIQTSHVPHRSLSKVADELISNCFIVNEPDYTFYHRREQGSPKQIAERAEGCSSKEYAKNALVDANRERIKPTSNVEPTDKIEAAANVRGLELRKPSYSFSYGLADQEMHRIDNARLLACSCFGGKLWSVTVRSKSKDRKGFDGIHATSPSPSPPPKCDSPDAAIAESEYRAEDTPEGLALFSIKNLCDQIAGLLFEEDRAAQGAVIVTGATDSAKSLITKGLIYYRLENCLSKYAQRLAKRRPHLVTVEDPIEGLLLPGVDKFGEGSFGGEWPVDYTPRELGVDVKTVSDALRDALRQTPSAVFISEIREDIGWRKLMEFAGTGHLVFTTAHAGSLAEAMGKVLKAVGAKTPADRAAVAERIHGLVHLRREVIGSSPALIPALWRHKGGGRHALVSDGLSAVTPGGWDRARDSCFGRLWFASELLKEECQNKDVKERRVALGNELLRRAREMDLEGR